MNMWLTAAPSSQVAHGALGCDVSLNDLCDRPPRALADGEVIDLGGKRVRADLDAARAPRLGGPGALRGDDRTLLCGDLFTQVGAGPALTTDDIVEPAVAAERMFHAELPSLPTPPRRCAGSATSSPTTLAIMHGSSYQGDGREALYDLAVA